MTPKLERPIDRLLGEQAEAAKREGFPVLRHGRRHAAR